MTNKTTDTAFYALLTALVAASPFATGCSGKGSSSKEAPPPTASGAAAKPTAAQPAAPAEAPVAELAGKVAKAPPLKPSVDDKPQGRLEPCNVTLVLTEPKAKGKPSKPEEAPYLIDGDEWRSYYFQADENGGTRVGLVPLRRAQAVARDSTTVDGEVIVTYADGDVIVGYEFDESERTTRAVVAPFSDPMNYTYSYSYECPTSPEEPPFFADDVTLDEP